MVYIICINNIYDTIHIAHNTDTISEKNIYRHTKTQTHTDTLRNTQTHVIYIVNTFVSLNTTTNAQTFHTPPASHTFK